MSPTSCSTSERIGALDAWRGLACWCMLVYHLAFDLFRFGWLSWEQFDSVPMFLLERFIAWSFILCAGISCCLSRGNIRRGLICAAAGALVVAASYAVGAPIRFGILQFLSAGMLLYGLFGKWLRLPYRAAPVAYLALYAAAKWWTGSVTVRCRWLFWLGLRYEGFVSYDYFPLLPYIFLFLLGGWLGEWLPGRRGARLLSAPMPAALTWTGRHTLLIYLVHQPVLYGACWLAARL